MIGQGIPSQEILIERIKGINDFILKFFGNKRNSSKKNINIDKDLEEFVPGINKKPIKDFGYRKMESGQPENKGSKLFMKKSHDKKCFVCEKVNIKAMNSDISITLDLWKNKEYFRENFRKQEYFCFKHNRLLINEAKNKLSKKEFQVFREEITNVQMKYCKELENDLGWFINKFDYRYSSEPWYNAKDSIYRAREILRRDNT